MTRPRKTIAVAELRDSINRMIAATPDDWTRERRGLYVVLESVLQDSGNYHGFRYMDIDETTRNADGFPTDFGDETRRHYY